MSVDPIHPHSKSAAVTMPGLLGQPGRMQNLSPAEQGKAVSSQFEAILLRQFLQDSVGNIMGGKDAGPTGNVYGYLLTDVLASKLTEGGGLGLSKILTQQLTPRFGGSTTADAASTPSTQAKP